MMQAAMPPPAIYSPAPFADDFARGVDPGRWTALARTTANKPQLQCYVPGQVSGGPRGLVIAVGTTAAPPPWCKGQRYVSGRLQSRQSFRFGRLTVRARLPAGKGLWPAMWMRTPEGAPLSGEIDLVEGYGSRPDLVQGTVHGWADGKHLGADCGIAFTRGVDQAFAARHRCTATALPAKPLDRRFHDYMVEWRPDRVTWFLDGQPFFRTTKFVPQGPMAIVLELQLGGVFDGAPDARTRFPAALEIRSVRFDPLTPR